MMSKRMQSAEYIYWQLWHRYKRLTETKTNVQFRDVKDFIAWSKQSGYQYGMKLIRLDERKPWSKSNCKWVENEPNSPTSIRKRQGLAKQWDEFITPIRERYKGWKPPEPPQPKGKECFRYEHPDLVREGIVWTGENPLSV